MDDDETLAPAHVGLPPVPEHTCNDDCNHIGLSMDIPKPAFRCSRCGDKAWRLWNMRIKKCRCAEGVSCDHLTGSRREFFCLNDTCKMRWWEHKGRMGPL